MCHVNFRRYYIGTVGVMLFVAAQALADENAGAISILRGLASKGKDQTVSVTITPKEGKAKTFKVDVAAGESSRVTTQKLADKINADTDLSAKKTEHDMGADTVDDVNIRSVEAGFKIKSITIDPDNSGYKNHSIQVGKTIRNDKRAELRDRNPIDPGLVKLAALIVDDRQIVGEFELVAPNGTPASSLLGQLSSSMNAAGFSNVFGGDSLTLRDVPPSREFFFGLINLDAYQTPAYTQNYIATPEPASLPLVTLGLLPALARRGRRHFR